MTQGPKNDFLHRRQQQMGSPPVFKVPEVRFCPFSIRPPVESSVVGADGKEAPPRINASPCLGPACMAFTAFQPAPGVSPVAACLHCLMPNMLMDISAQLDRIAVASGAPRVALVATDPAPPQTASDNPPSKE